MLITISSNLILTWLYRRNNMVNNEQEILDQLLARNIAGFVFVLSKTPKDCFFCFSRLKNIKYSSWQYIKYVYTEQFLMIQRNAYLLAKLQQLNPGKMVVLDEDDYLNPLLSTEAHKKGVDMNFMVEWVGEGDEGGMYRESVGGAQEMEDDGQLDDYNGEANRSGVRLKMKDDDNWTNRTGQYLSLAKGMPELLTGERTPP